MTTYLFFGQDDFEKIETEKLGFRYGAEDEKNKTFVVTIWIKGESKYKEIKAVSSNINFDHFRFCNTMRLQILAGKHVFLGKHFDYSYGVQKSGGDQTKHDTPKIVHRQIFEKPKYESWKTKSSPRFQSNRNSAPRFVRHHEKPTIVTNN